MSHKIHNRRTVNKYQHSILPTFYRSIFQTDEGHISFINFSEFYFSTLVNNFLNEKSVGERVTNKVQIITFNIILHQRRSGSFFNASGRKIGLETRMKSGNFYDDICFQFYMLF